MKKRNQGFTLIELLVVIAIIGILSSIVLASLNTARTKGADASIKGNMNGIRPQAELYYDTNGSYGAAMALGACPGTGTMFAGDANINAAITQAAAQAGVAVNATRCVNILTTAYGVAIPLKTAGQSWCVDSTGQSKQFAGTPTQALNATTGACS